METLPFGARARLTVTFTNAISDELADPTTVTLRLRSPASVETTYTFADGDIERESEGVYIFDNTFGEAGDSGGWLARWVAGGALVAAHEFRFRVEASAFTDP